MMSRTLLKTDKNGTKYWECTDKCFKCGGTGFISCYIPINGGECFECGGTGVVQWTEKEYTPEYEAKLEARRLKRLEKNFEPNSKKSLKKLGFNEDGQMFLFMGNTYSIKDSIKEAGGRYNWFLRWHIDHDVEGFNTVMVTPEQICRQFGDGSWDFDNDKYDYIKSITTIQEEVPETFFFGEVGDKIEVKVKYIRSIGWETDFGYGYWTNNVMYRHIFRDDAGHIFTWKTSISVTCDEGSEVILKGTIKAHTEYKNDKQTEMTRCKVLGTE